MKTGQKTCTTSKLTGSLVYPNVTNYVFRGHHHFSGLDCNRWEDPSNSQLQYYDLNNRDRTPVAIVDDSQTLFLVDYTYRKQDPAIFDIPAHLSCTNNSTTIAR